MSDPVFQGYSFEEEQHKDELCSMFCISKTSLQGCFKSMYGTSPANYIRREKIKYAAQLIVSEGEKSIGEIACEVGYDNASKFSAAFRSVMYECPLEFRKRNLCKNVQIVIVFEGRFTVYFTSVF